MYEAFLNRDDEPGSWTWYVQEDGEYLCDLPLPYDAEADEYDISSRALFEAAQEEQLDTAAHWKYWDGDYGIIGEWNRSEED
ncbi:hypothetical protein JW921_05925 [Candidatus Fermentibacterales bacterium]|nr:hypothetical protein [Candidatus Fermentibacterales bacterium]